MEKFNILDIVKLKGARGDDKVLYMVVDVMDFTKTSDIGSKPVIDIDCELMQIYPIQKNAKYVTLSQDDLEIHEKHGYRYHELFMRFIQRDREKKGWYGEPDFIRLANHNLESKKKNEVTATKDGFDVSVNIFKMPVKRLDVIRYDTLETIDECLDAINHLNALHKMFGDESYIQLKELVTARIIRLQK